MITHESRNGAAAGRGMHPDLLLAEPPNGPAVGKGSGIESGIPNPIILSIMPIVAVSLNDKSRLLEHEVGLPSPEHGLVHLEVKTALLELRLKGDFDGGHLRRQRKPEASLTMVFAFFGALSTAKIPFIPKQGLSQFFSCFRRESFAQIRPPHPFPCFRRNFMSKVSLSHLFPRLRAFTFAQSRLTNVLSIFGGTWLSLINSCRHLVFNYSMAGAR